ncbi:MAG TPA: hypothetical protein PKD83_06590 [Ignavibacteria bacterium]|nr:hypothetical protein [Ignavibacteria bacterium]
MSNKHVHIIDISRLKLKVFYELEIYEEIFFEIDNLKHFIRKSGISSILIDNTNDFLGTLSGLMKIITGPGTKKKIRYIAEKFTNGINKNPKIISVDKLNDHLNITLDISTSQSPI